VNIRTDSCDNKHVWGRFC